MKKLILVLAVLLVSLPAMAAVTITATCDQGVYTVGYATDGNLPRAFALDITVAAGTITAVGNLSTSYDIYPGSIVIVDGAVSNAGSAVCDASYPDTLGGIGTAGVTIEMGSLYAVGDTAPAASGTLFTFTTSEAETVATITENAIRGGLVMENPAENVTPVITVTDCETVVPNCPMDVDGDGWISSDDVAIILVYLDPYADQYYWVEATPETANMDVDGDGWVSSDDAAAMLVFLDPYADQYYWVECPQQ